MCVSTSPQLLSQPTNVYVYWSSEGVGVAVVTTDELTLTVQLLLFTTIGDQ